MNVLVVITTKNRKTLLRKALWSALSQAMPVDVLVVDDNSTDGTADMVEAEFRQVKLERSPEALGYIVQRNRAARISSADVIISIDDDAVFSSPLVVEQAVAELGNPRVAAVAIPYMEPQKSREILQRAPDRKKIWVTDMFRGTAYAVRRDIFLALGGYREQLIHQGEERDFCIRLLNRGFVVRLGSGDHVIHNEMPKRDWTRLDFYGRRNDILFAWNNVPWPFYITHLIGTTLRGACLATTRGKMGMARGILAGYRDFTIPSNVRMPVARVTYRLHRALKKRGPLPLSDIQHLLPQLDNLHSPPVPTARENLARL
jgi:glycosyltransferase involved in cell wall biosynthesis